jgi:hypothetical protein
MTTSRAGSKPALVPGKRTGRVMRSAERISPERARMMIQTGMLISELEAIGTGKKEAESHQVTALVALLRKTLPDLQATMISGDPNLPLTIITRAE